nr:hypothetical protein [uncultured Chitinophaga sp.]
MKQIFFGAFMLSSVPAAGQEGNTYRMTTVELYAKTIDGGFNERTYYVLRFEAGKAGLCSYTLKTEQKNALLRNTLSYTDWQYFKYQKKGNRISIAGLPPYCAVWTTLQIRPNALTSIKNENIIFRQLEQPAAGAIIGNSYAAPVDAGTDLVFTFGKDSVEVAYMKKISGESRKAGKYRWMGYGTHILVPEYGHFLTADFDKQQLQLLYNDKYISLKQRML